MEWCADQRPFCGAARVRVSLFALLLTAIGCADATDDAAEASSLNVPSLPSQNDFGVAERIDGRVESADAAAVADAMSVRLDAEMQIDSGIENCAPSERLCGRQCVSTATDVENCGACGITCIVPNGSPRCTDGLCAIDTCTPPFEDRDGDADNGCEYVDMCEAGAPCDTACGTVGQIACDGGDGSCVPPAEVCNGVDDDCNGRCDDGTPADCRVSIGRTFGPDGHAYSDDVRPLVEDGFRVESGEYFFLYQNPSQGMRPVHLCRKPDGSYLLSSDNDCSIGRAPRRTIGFWSPSPLCNSQPLYRLYKADINNHFYTLSAAERDRAINELGYQSEGIAGHVWRGP